MLRNTAYGRASRHQLHARRARERVVSDRRGRRGRGGRARRARRRDAPVRPRARLRAAARMARRAGRASSPSRSSPRNGSLQIVEFLCLALLKPGDVVFTEVADLRPHDHAAAAPWRASRRDPARGRRPGHRGARGALAKHVAEVLLPDPRLPEPGRRDLLRREARAASSSSREQHGFLLLEDAPYRLLRYRGTEEPTLFSSPPSSTLHMSSFTKLIAPGVRVGFMIGDPAPPHREAREGRRGHVHLAGVRRAGHHLRVVPPRPAGAADRAPEEALRAAPRSVPRRARPLHAGRAPTRPDGGFFLSLTLPEGVETTAVRPRAAKRESEPRRRARVLPRTAAASASSACPSAP